MVHLGDEDLLAYLGSYPLLAAARDLQHRLSTALKYRRKGLYRTLLVVDMDLTTSSEHTVDFFTGTLRDETGQKRRAIERDLAAAARLGEGDVLVYCPSGRMQAKEVDARLEIAENRVLPLRKQRDAFAYQADVDVLEAYYSDLWRAYVFVSPEAFQSKEQCQLIVDRFAEIFGISRAATYRKVRGHDFVVAESLGPSEVLGSVRKFLDNLPVSGLSAAVISRLLKAAEADESFLSSLRTGSGDQPRLSELFDAVLLAKVLEEKKERSLKPAQARALERYLGQLMAGEGRAPGQPGHQPKNWRLISRHTNKS